MYSRIIGTVAGCLVVAAAAYAELDVVLENGDSVRGTLLPATETETFRFACPAGAKIAVSAASRGTRMRVAATLLDPHDVVAGGGAGRRARIAAIAAESGIQRVEVSSADGVTTGDYALSVRWRSPKSFARTLAVAANSTADLAFAADAGAHVTFTLVVPRGSAATPSLVRVRDADGSLFPLQPGTQAAFDVPATGTYTMTFENGAAAGDVVARAAVRRPKSAGRRLSATTREIPPGTDIVAAAVIDAHGGVIAAPANGPLADARVTVPEGALSRAAIVVLGTAADLAPPNPSRSTQATPPAFVGPLGATFAASSHPTVDLPLAVSGDVPVDAALRVYASGVGTGPDVVPGAGTDGSLVTFAPARLARFQGYYVVLPQVAEPLVVDTMSNRALGYVAMGGGFAFVASPYSYDFYSGGAVGEGLVRVFERVGATWVERGTLKSPAPVDSDFFGSTMAYRTSPQGASDDSLLVGVRNLTGVPQGNPQTSAIFEFVRSGSEWTYLRQLPPVGDYRFAVDGDRVLTLGWYVPTLTDLRRGPQAWTAAAPLPVGHAQYSLDLRGGTLLLGAPYSEPPAAHSPGSAYRFDVSGAGAVQLARYGAPAPEAQDDFFGATVSLGEHYAAASGPNPASYVAMFRLADDAPDGTVAPPVLPAYRNRAPALRGFRMHDDTLFLTAGPDAGGQPFVGGFVFRREDGAWTHDATFDATPLLQFNEGEWPYPSDVGFDGTTVVMSIAMQAGSSPPAFRSAVAFFDLPQQ